MVRKVMKGLVKVQEGYAVVSQGSGRLCSGQSRVRKVMQG